MSALMNRSTKLLLGLGKRTKSRSFAHQGKFNESSGANVLSHELLQKINQLDVASSKGNPERGGGGVSSTKRQKLKRPLETPDKKTISGAQLGALEATAEDLQDVLVETMSKPSFANLFRGASDPADAVYIDSVKLNQDCSHATVKWKSDTLQLFVRKVTAQLGQEKGRQLTRRSIKYVNSRFQSHEAKFRSAIIREMHFRRVPRLFFQPWDDSLGVAPRRLNSQELVQRELRWRRDVRGLTDHGHEESPQVID